MRTLQALGLDASEVRAMSSALSGVESKLQREARRRRGAAAPPRGRAAVEGHPREQRWGSSLQMLIGKYPALSAFMETPRPPVGSNRWPRVQAAPNAPERALAQHALRVRRLGLVALDQIPVDEKELYALGEWASGRLRADLSLLAAACAYMPFWLRPLSEFRTKGRGLDVVRTDLVHHLFCRFSVPTVLRTSWRGALASNLALDEGKTWFVALGAGMSLRRLEKAAPVRFSGASARLLRPYLDVLPARMDFEQGRRLAEVWAAGGAEVEHRALERNEAFRLTFLTPRGTRWPTRVRPQTFRDTVRWLVHHRSRLGDNVAEILRWVAQDEAHRMFERSEVPLHQLDPSAIETLAAKETNGWPIRYGDWADGGWTVSELCSAQALADEGESMHHCVGGYAQECADGDSAIFSVRKDARRRLTVEVDIDERRVVQIKGFDNRAPTPSELRMVERWARTVVRPRGSWRSGEI